MSVRKATQLGDPRLKATNKTVTDFTDPIVLKVIKDLVDTMHERDLIGMAAPQIGENWKIFVTEPRQTKSRPASQSDILRVYINPKIVRTSKETVEIYEGCGSVVADRNSTIFGPVIRPKIVTIEAYDAQGKKFRITADGILGRVLQHEVDHLHGIEFIEKVVDYRRLLSSEFYIHNIKPDPIYLNASKITVKKVETTRRYLK